MTSVAGDGDSGSERGWPPGGDEPYECRGPSVDRRLP